MYYLDPEEGLFKGPFEMSENTTTEIRVTKTAIS
jgi:hypothetical protein